MTEMTNAAKTSNEAATSTAAAWPQRFGTMTKIQVKSGRKGKYAIVTLNCNKFTQTAFAFGDKLVDQITKAGEGASVWFKGPIESVQRDGYSEDQMKIVYFKDKTVREDAAAQAEDGSNGADAGVSEETASAVASTVEEEDEIPF